MNKNLLRDDVRKFIHDNISSDLAKLALSKSPFPDIPLRELLVQIEGKKRAKEKLPTFYNNDSIIYPPAVSMEQSSSEQAAFYKSSLLSGKALLDLSGGFGVDSLAFSMSFEEVFYCELNEALAAIALHNFATLSSHNIRIHAGCGLTFLREHAGSFDCIYIDPSRRDTHNRRMHAFADCTPDVVANMELFFEHAPKVMIKASPMFDIGKALSELRFVKEVHIVAIKNDVREVLYLLEKEAPTSVRFFTINFTASEKHQKFSFLNEEADSAQAAYSLPLRYLYEPNNAIMKSGAFELVAKHFNVYKLHKNSHLYTSNVLIDDFPGRSFEIMEALPYKKITHLSKANVTVRNFPDTTEKALKKLNIKEGGDTYLFCTIALNDKPVVLQCRKTASCMPDSEA